MEPMVLVMVAVLNMAVLATMMTKMNEPLSGIERKKIMLNKDFKHSHVRWLAQHREVTTYQDDYDYSERTRVKVTTSIFATPAKLLKEIIYYWSPIECPHEWNRTGYDESHTEDEWAEGYMWFIAMLQPKSSLNQIFQAFYKTTGRNIIKANEKILKTLGFNYDEFYEYEDIDIFLDHVFHIAENGYYADDYKVEANEPAWEAFDGYDMGERIGQLTPLMLEIYDKFKADFAKSFDEIGKNEINRVLYMLPFVIGTYSSYESNHTLTVTPLRRLTNKTIDSICMCEGIRLDETTQEREHREYCEWEQSEEGQKEIAAAEKAHAERMRDLATFMGESGLSSYSCNGDGTYTCW